MVFAFTIFYGAPRLDIGPLQLAHQMFKRRKMGDGIAFITPMTSFHLAGTYATGTRSRIAAMICAAASSALIIIGSLPAPLVIGVSTGPGLIVITATPNRPSRLRKPSRYVSR